MELDINNFKEIFAEMEKTFKDKKDDLTALDSAMGDGDLGRTMEKSFVVANEVAKNYEGQDVGELLKKAGFEIANKAAATMGTLTGSAFIKAGSEAAGNSAVDYNQLIVMFEKAIEGIKTRGKAEVGDKTMLDTLVPAYQALKAEKEKGADLKTGMEKATAAAKEGLEETKNMVSQFGRAHYYGEKSRGKKDPGAAASVFFLETVNEYIMNI